MFVPGGMNILGIQILCDRTMVKGMCTLAQMPKCTNHVELASSPSKPGDEANVELRLSSGSIKAPT